MHSAGPEETHPPVWKGQGSFPAGETFAGEGKEGCIMCPRPGAGREERSPRHREPTAWARVGRGERARDRERRGGTQRDREGTGATERRKGSGVSVTDGTEKGRGKREGVWVPEKSCIRESAAFPGCWAALGGGRRGCRR